MNSGSQASCSCEKKNKTCQTESCCGCATWKQDESKCGCATWNASIDYCGCASYTGDGYTFATKNCAGYGANHCRIVTQNAYTYNQNCTD